jgi:type IV pilus assembly protein PilC
MAAENTIFVWTGTDRNGRKSKGEVLAITAAIARVQLRKQGIAAKSVKKKPRPLISFGAKRFSQPISPSSPGNWPP